MGRETAPSVDRIRSEGLRLWLPFIFAATDYLMLVTRMDKLLRDSDTYWHIVVGQWIIDHRAVPHADLFSFTMPGAPWTTSAWLSEVLYFGAFELAGWAGPAILAASASSIAFFLLTVLLLKRLPNVPVAILVGAGIAMLTFRTLARPHVLIFPLIVLWTDTLLSAVEERRAPSIPSVALMTLWANLHGSFTLGLVMIAPFALEALWTADKARFPIAMRWLRFGLLAAGASCITPYGAESILVTLRLLNFGALLAHIGEWSPLEFGTPNPVTLCVLAGAGYAMHSGLRLPPLRIAVLLGLLYETFAHIRYVDVFALVAPFLIAGPLGFHLYGTKPPYRHKAIPLLAKPLVLAIATVTLATEVIVATTDAAPPRVPRAAVDKLKALRGDRILNDYYFCGYLMFQGIPVFIDSRAEFYGPAFLTRYARAISLEDLADFVRLLDEYKIDSTLFFPSTQAVGLLDRLPEWERIYADDIAVVHVRRMRSESERSPH